MVALTMKNYCWRRIPQTECLLVKIKRFGSPATKLERQIDESWLRFSHLHMFALAEEDHMFFKCDETLFGRNGF